MKARQIKWVGLFFGLQALHTKILVLSEGGYTLITPIGGDMTCLIYEEGKIVHRWQMTDFMHG